MLKYRIVTICGSRQFYHQMLFIAEKLTSQGYIVLLPFKNVEGYDEMQYARISISDAILVVNTHGHIPLETRNEVLYAFRSGKFVYYLYPALVNRGVLAANKQTSGSIPVVKPLDKPTVEVKKIEDVETVVLEKRWNGKI